METSHHSLTSVLPTATSSRRKPVSELLRPRTRRPGPRSYGRNPGPVAPMIVRERQSATTLDLPATCRMSAVYSEMYESRRCWRADHGSATSDMQSVSGLWSTKAANSQPSRRNRKWRIASQSVRSSLSNALCSRSLGVDWRLKKASGCQAPSTHCSCAAATA